MKYEDEEENFLSDKKIEERYPQSDTYRRRGGSYENQIKENNEEKRIQKVENEESGDIFNTVIIIIAIIVIIIAIFVMIKVFKGTSDTNEEQNTNNNVTQTDNSNNQNNASNSSNSDSNNSSNLSISSINENYNAYPIEIESVVHVKGGNFYNNYEGIEGDKAYVEYKQINGLKDEDKQDEINEMLKSLSVDFYDKNYLGDENTLFIDVHTKLSVNFNTLSYVVYKTYEDIDGNRVNEDIKTLNISLEDMEEIEFENLFTDNANIKTIYKEYVKGKVNTFYFDPQYIYIYNDDLEEIKIDMKDNYKNIAIYNRFKDDTKLFESSSVSKKVFTILESTVSEETKDRAFVSSK